MSLDYRITISEIDSWCAAAKVSGINRETIKGLTLKDLVKAANADVGANSCLCITVNDEEVEVIEWLNKKKFVKGPDIKNWCHGGRNTCMYFKQLSPKQYNM